MCIYIYIYTYVYTHVDLYFITVAITMTATVTTISVISTQTKELLVATPGRLVDLMTKRRAATVVDYIIVSSSMAYGIIT